MATIGTIWKGKVTIMVLVITGLILCGFLIVTSKEEYLYRYANNAQMCNCNSPKYDQTFTRAESHNTQNEPAREETNDLLMINKTGKMHTIQSSDRPCTLDDIKKYSLQSGFFPNQTKWMQSSPSRVHYNPGWCKFNQIQVQGEYISKCLEKKKIRTIAIIGDSNGGRFTNEIRYHLKDCMLVKAEKNNDSLYYPNPHYYSDNTAAVIWHSRTCRHCHSSLFYCPGAQIRLEFISGEYVIDTELVTVRARPKDEQIKSKNLCSALGSKAMRSQYGGKLPCVESHNSQQFILKEYFAGNHPDLILYFSNNHDRQIFTADEFGVYNRLLGGLLDLYLPDTTKLVWMTKLHEENVKMPEGWAQAVYERKYSANEQLQRMNRKLYETSLEYFKKRDNFYPFFDLQSMGVEVADIWAEDGVHKKRPWYTHVVSYIFQALCES